MSVRKSSVRPVLFSIFSSSLASRRWRPGLRSTAMAGAFLGVLLAAGNARAAATTYTVNATTDTGTGSGDTGDLRYALTQAESAGNSGSTINITATGTITLTSALPAITQDTTISGPGANQLTISGAKAYAPLAINSGATVSISGVTIADGKSVGDGGAIANAGTLTVSNCAFLENSAAHGGGIRNAGTLTVAASAFIKNSASSNGGGIYNSSGSVAVTNSTFVANSANNAGGGIYNIASLAVDNSTFWGNSAPGGGGVGSEGTLTLTNSILAESNGTNYTGVSSTGTVSKEEHNLFYGNAGSDTSFTLSATDVTGQDPKLLPFGNYGGGTLTMLPQPGSPAICAGKATDVPSGVTTDQRGFALNAANCSNGGVDAGAVQTAYVKATSTLPSSYTGPEDVDLTGLSGTVSTSGIAVSGGVNLIGPGANKLTLSGGNANQVLSISSGASAVLYGVTIANGKVSSGSGGGIENAGTLAIIESAVSGNSANSGGGVDSNGTLTVIGSTFSGNSAPSGNGGAIFSSGLLTVINSTFSGNTVVGGAGVGGAIKSDGTLTVTNSTFSGNAADNVGAIAVFSGSATVDNSVFADNSAAGSGAGMSNSGTLNASNNVYYNNLDATTTEDDCDSCSSNANAVNATSEPLAALASYGGTTQTMLPLPISTGAICVGSSSLAVDANGNALTTDQRGFSVGAASYCASGSIDAGAVQTNYTSAQFTNDTGYSALVNQAVTPAPIVSVTENGQNIGGVPITLTFTGSGTPSGLGPETTVAGAGATFSDIEVDTAGLTDSLSLSLPVGTTSLAASADLEIDGPGILSLTPSSGALTDAYLGVAYSNTLVASGGKGGYTYAVSTGALPSFLTLDSTTGKLSGTPTTTGNYSYSITATDNKGNTGSADYTLAVDLDETSIAVTSSKNPSSANDSVTFTATVTNTSGTSVPSAGTVAFTSDGVGISGCGTKALVAGSSSATATCSVDSLTAASSPHSIVATYSGDSATYAGSTSTALSQTVNKASTSVTVTSSGAAGLNQQVTLTATVSPTGPVALGTGTVAFSDGATAISGCGTQAVNASTGQATCTASFTTAGSHTISAIYSGDSNYAQTTSGNVTTLPLSVNKANTNLSISSTDNTTGGLAANTSNLNDSVTFTATVTPASPVTGGTALSGKVTFTSNGQTLCAAAAGTWDSTAQSYQVACTTAALSAGTPSIAATYSNDSNYGGSTNSLTQTINKAATTLAVISSAPTSTVNQSVTFTASVTPFSGQVTLSGNVAFTATNTSTSAVTTLCTVGITASTGVAACATASLPAGSYTVTANYGNDPNYVTSSNTVAQTVGKAAVTISLASSPNPSTVNQQVALTATVSANGGGTALNGQVTFTSDGNLIADCPATTINPNSPTVVCKTTSLALGTHSLVANYGGDANFSDNSSTPVSQAVNAAPTSLAITSSASGNISVVDQAVSFTATVSGASGATHFAGTMSFTDNGNAIAGCSGMAVGATTGSATCATSALLHGSHTIAATYAGDTNFNTSTNSLTQTVNPGNSTITLVSSPNPSIALNPKGYNDQVGLTATVGPTSGVLLSGSVTFTDNGAPIAECQSGVPVNPTTGTASCITSSLGFGSHTIQAAYNGDSNFTASGATITQSVQDYTLSASPTGTVTVGQRSTNTTDAFSQEAISVSATPIAGFTGQLALSCTVVPVSAPDGAVPPTCILGSTSIPITASAQQQPVSVTIDAGTGSNPVATTGTYNVSITGVDSATGLTRTSAAFVVNIRFQAAPITIVSGATSGNTSTVQFSLPPNVGITTIQCTSVTGPTLTSSVAPVALSMGCAFDPSTIAAASTSQDVMVTVTVSTSATTTAKLNDHRTTVVMAGMIGVPLLLLFGLMPCGKSSRKVLLRFMAVAFAVVLVLQGTGCGGGQFTAPPSVSGQTPPGSYNILVQGTGTDHQLYQAVIQVNVTR